MSAKPILFSGPMIRALLDGRKTQTRRIAKVTSAGCNQGFITPITGYVPRRPAEPESLTANAELTGDGLRSSTASGAAPLLDDKEQKND